MWLIVQNQTKEANTKIEDAMKFLFCLLTAAALLCGCQKTDSKAALESKINALQSQIASLNSQINDLVKSSTNLTGRVTALETTEQIKEKLAEWQLLHDPATSNFYSATPRPGKLEPATGLPWPNQ